MAERGIAIADNGVTRVLVINAAVLLATLASYPLFYRAGMWSQVTTAYIVITFGLLWICLLALVIANTIDATVGIAFYAWGGFAAVFGMVALDVLGGAREFPWILYCLHGGVFGLGWFGAKYHKAAYAVASALVVLLAGAVYRQYDQAVACCVSLVLIALWRVHNDGDKSNRG